jgi:hypothetical protein
MPRHASRVRDLLLIDLCIGERFGGLEPPWTLL